MCVTYEDGDLEVYPRLGFIAVYNECIEKYPMSTTQTGPIDSAKMDVEPTASATLTVPAADGAPTTKTAAGVCDTQPPVTPMRPEHVITALSPVTPMQLTSSSDSLQTPTAQATPSEVPRKSSRRAKASLYRRIASPSAPATPELQVSVSDYEQVKKELAVMKEAHSRSCKELLTARRRIDVLERALSTAQDLSSLLSKAVSV